MIAKNLHHTKGIKKTDKNGINHVSKNESKNENGNFEKYDCVGTEMDDQHATDPVPYVPSTFTSNDKLNPRESSKNVRKCSKIMKKFR